MRTTMVDNAKTFNILTVPMCRVGAYKFRIFKMLNKKCETKMQASRDFSSCFRLSLHSSIRVMIDVAI